MSITEMRKALDGASLKKKYLEFSFGHFKLELLIGHPGGDVKYRIRFIVQSSLEKSRLKTNTWEL